MPWSKNEEEVWHYYRSQGRTGGYADKVPTENIAWRSACRHRWVLDASRPFAEDVPPLEDNAVTCAECRRAFHEDVLRADKNADMEEKDVWGLDSESSVWHHFKKGAALSVCKKATSTVTTKVVESFDEVLGDPDESYCGVCREATKRAEASPQVPLPGPHRHYLTSLQIAKDILDDAAEGSPSMQHVGRLAIEVAYLCGRAEQAMVPGPVARILSEALSGLSEGADAVIQEFGPMLIQLLAQQSFAAGFGANPEGDEAPTEGGADEVG